MPTDPDPANPPVGNVDAAGPPDQVSDAPVPEQPPMIGGDDADKADDLRDRLTDDLSVQGGE